MCFYEFFSSNESCQKTVIFSRFFPSNESCQKPRCCAFTIFFPQMKVVKKRCVFTDFSPQIKVVKKTRCVFANFLVNFSQQFLTCHQVVFVSRRRQKSLATSIILGTSFTLTLRHGNLFYETDTQNLLLIF